MIRAGVDPGLLDEVVWWQTDDLWIWALDALAVYVRVAADLTGPTVADVCRGSRNATGSISARRADVQNVSLGPHRTTRARTPNEHAEPLHSRR